MRTKLTLTLVLLSFAALAAPLEHTKVGNGDDGSDLEGAIKLTTGPIVDARLAAVRVLERLGTPSIPGLGLLLPEVERATLYLAKRDVKEGHFARTLPEPHAPTRFFPSALKLDRDQLISLHIHEGLHRALPESIRTDEDIVGEITLAITAPEATTDRVISVVQRHLEKRRAQAEPEPEVKDPSSIAYGIRQYLSSQSELRIERMHHGQLELTPFQLSRWMLGIGIQASIIEATGGGYMGPLTVAPRLRYVAPGDFDVSGFLSGSFAAFANEKTRLSIAGRDVYTIGLSARKERGRGFFELRTGWSFVSNNVPPLRYGSVLHARFGTGVRFGKIEAGAFAEYHLADYTKIELGSFGMVTAGPEIWYVDGPMAFGLTGRYLLFAPAGYSLDQLGSLAGYGVGRGNLGLNARWSF